VTHNAALGQRDGVPKEKFAALADYTTNPLFSDLERLVIRYAEEMTEKVQVDSRLVEELKKQLGPEALVQLTLSIAAPNWRLKAEEIPGLSETRKWHSLPVARGALAQRSRNVSPQMERAWPSRTRRRSARLPPWSKRLNLVAERLSRSKRTLPTSKLSRARSKRPSRPSADLMCL